MATQSKTLDDDLAHFGAPKEKPVEQPTLWVLSDNWQAVTAITTAGTQWKLDHQGVELALDYNCADIAWRYAGIELSPDDFARVQTLERTIIGHIRRPDEQQSEFGVTLTV
nr:DUF1799 domain-containing protein [Pseudoalteromonas sp. BDTF-M6]